MTRQRHPNLVKWSSLIGAHLILASLSFLWIYGNLFVYLDSYFEFSCSPGCKDASAQWIISLYISLVPFGAFVLDPLERKIGAKACGLLSAVVGCAAMFGMAWTVKVSIIGTALLAGLVFSPCVGLVMSVSLHYINRWAPERVAVLTATATSFPTILAILQNQAITLYLNPDNLRPDVVQGPKTYFSQPGLLRRVPRVIVILAAMTLALQLIGNLMLFSPPKTTQPAEVKQPDHLCEATAQCQPSVTFSCTGKTNTAFDDSLDSTSKPRVANVSTTQSRDISRSSHPINQLHATMIDAGTTSSSDTISNQNCGNIDNCTDSSLVVLSIADLDKDIISGDHSYHGLKDMTRHRSYDKTTEGIHNAAHSQSSNFQGRPTKTVAEKSLKPREVLKTRAFWSTWLTATSLAHCLLVENNYYKDFGLIYIPDDTFLTAVGSTIPVVSTVSRVGFGLLLDKTIISVQDALVLSQVLQAILTAFWFFAAQTNKYVYMLVLLALAAVNSMFYVILPTASRKIFGPAHFAINYAMLFTSLFVTGISTAIVVQPILDNLGWFWLFTVITTFSVIALLITAVSNFKIRHYASMR